jgi:hypothetical protein
VALMHARVDLRRSRVRLDVIHPVVVTNVSLRGAGEAKNRGGEATGDDSGKSELLHFDAFFFSVRIGRFGLFGAGLTD